VSCFDVSLRTAYPYSHLEASSLLPRAVTDNASFLKDVRVHGFSREKAIFLDVETTGLSHGAGTIAFLVGLAWFEEDQIRVRQLLLHDYDEEQAQLHMLLEALSRFTFLVSYNGKSFDTSILENRLVVNRFMDRNEAHVRLMPHLDLLHVGRRIHRGRLPDHRLPTLEREILGFFRPDDISGAQVPELYFRYLLENDPALISPVLEHNRDDVVSLIHLAHCLLDTIQPLIANGDPLIDYNLGKLFHQTRYPEAARVHFESAVRSPDPDLAASAARLLATTMRRLERARA